MTECQGDIGRESIIERMVMHDLKTSVSHLCHAITMTVDRTVTAATTKVDLGDGSRKHTRNVREGLLPSLFV